jgi:succinyl-CoA synthetase beta subunit
MTAVNTLDDVKRDYRYVWEFKAEYIAGLYKRDANSCLALSKVMGVDFKAVYRHESQLTGEFHKNKWDEGNVDWDTETFYAVNPKGKVIVFSNSEWGGVGLAK